MLQYTEQELKEIYSKTLEYLKKIKPLDDHWFEDSYLYNIDEDFATIIVSTSVIKTILMGEEFRKAIEESFTYVTGKKLKSQIFLKSEISSHF